MQKFPALEDNQVALVRAHSSTGHILDENNILALHKEQNVYTVFSNLDLAIEYAENAVKTNKDLEIVIYGKQKEVIKYITPV